MKIIFKEYGESMGTRRLGGEIREKAISAIKNSQFVVFDLSDVKVLSNCFADECFGKLVEDFSLSEIKSTTSFTGTNRLTEHVIKKAITDRINKKRQD